MHVSDIKQGGLNINQGSCQVLTNNESYSGVLCTALPYSLSYFAWVQCGNNVWASVPRSRAPRPRFPLNA
jgi:hypothetical protein